MIYLDNAATSWPKPPGVAEAMLNCLEEKGANPGRSGHRMSLAAGKVVDAARASIARLFNIPDRDRVIFTLNATDALNMALKGVLKPGDHVVTTSMEHNSVTRPLYGLRKIVSVTKVPCAPDGSLEAGEIEKAVRMNTRVIVVTHASNVTGTVMPVREIGALARQKGLIFIVDAAQSAGILDIDAQNMNIDLLAMPGHKGLMGPPGTGVLYVGERVDLRPFREGGTGSRSTEPDQPEVMPEKYESGTLNSVGIAGLGAGVEFVHGTGLKTLRRHELELTRRFIEGAGKIPGMILFGPGADEERAPVVSFRMEGKDTGAVGAALDKWYNIACRAGLHCAPDAHRTLGTLESKLVRFSFSYFNTAGEVDFALQCLRDINKRDLPPANGGCNC
ncbi:MAG: aminotransferase class V-fold PLP-dependent enzyme [Firmicutes bacterium]|nr:aminotransferase class V-fold PLP-dependent enzyme [Bacillota bacterium]